MIHRPQPWTLPELDAYVESVMRALADNRDIVADARGEPRYEVTVAGRLPSGNLRIDIEADGSAIGMPTNTPLVVISSPDTSLLSWFMGDVLIASTPKGWEPKYVADAALNMDNLLSAHRRFVGRSGRSGRGV